MRGESLGQSGSVWVSLGLQRTQCEMFIFGAGIIVLGSGHPEVTSGHLWSQ